MEKPLGCYFQARSPYYLTVNFPTQVPDSDPHSPALLDLFTWLYFTQCRTLWVQVGIDLYIPHREYNVKPHSSPWFSAACAAAIVYRN